jgi:23S rRNA (cytidine1920-2'-O)/16S rRNA (cytidine1409-2'-O)-methyltransferase
VARVRLDQLLASRGLFPSREQAQRAILAGEVKIGTVVATKVGVKVDEDAEIDLKDKPRFVSRGGLKIEGALIHFGLEVEGHIGLDVGSSTGGFTDCLLQRGARRVFAFDVGTNQLAWKIRSDARVVSRENFNCRHLQPTDLDELADIAVMDLSFISLTLVLPAVVPCVKPGGHLVCLIKPQFELTPAQIGKGGIVREPEFRQEAIEKIRAWVTSWPGVEWSGLMESPITGTDGNVEYLVWLSRVGT